MTAITDSLLQPRPPRTPSSGNSNSSRRQPHGAPLSTLRPQSLVLSWEEALAVSRPHTDCSLDALPLSPSHSPPCPSVPSSPAPPVSLAHPACSSGCPSRSGRLRGSGPAPVDHTVPGCPMELPGGCFLEGRSAVKPGQTFSGHDGVVTRPSAAGPRGRGNDPSRHERMGPRAPSPLVAPVGLRNSGERAAGHLWCTEGSAPLGVPFGKQPLHAHASTSLDRSPGTYPGHIFAQGTSQRQDPPSILAVPRQPALVPPFPGLHPGCTKMQPQSSSPAAHTTPKQPAKGNAREARLSSHVGATAVLTLDDLIDGICCTDTAHHLLPNSASWALQGCPDGHVADQEWLTSALNGSSPGGHVADHEWLQVALRDLASSTMRSPEHTAHGLPGIPLASAGQGPSRELAVTPLRASSEHVPNTGTTSPEPQVTSALPETAVELRHHNLRHSEVEGQNAARTDLTSEAHAARTEPQAARHPDGHVDKMWEGVQSCSQAGTTGAPQGNQAATTDTPRAAALLAVLDIVQSRISDLRLLVPSLCMASDSQDADVAGVAVASLVQQLAVKAAGLLPAYLQVDLLVPVAARKMPLAKLDVWNMGGSANQGRGEGALPKGTDVPLPTEGSPAAESGPRPRRLPTAQSGSMSELTTFEGKVGRAPAPGATHNPKGRNGTSMAQKAEWQPKAEWQVPYGDGDRPQQMHNGCAMDLDTEDNLDAEIEDGTEQFQGDLDPSGTVLMELQAEELLAEYSMFCPICDRGFKREANLKIHMRGHGDQYKTMEILDSDFEIKRTERSNIRYCCPVKGCTRNKCHPEFMPLKTLVCMKNHYKRTHGPKPFKCSKCKRKSFAVVADLKTHEKHCGEVSRWICSCGNTFTRRDKLLRHLENFNGHTSAGHEFLARP